MLRTSSASAPEKLISYLEANLDKEGARLRRRAVIYRSAAGNWRLLGCVVEAFPVPERVPNPIASRHYSTTVLFEDWLNLEACHAFLDAIRAGKVMFDTIEIERKKTLSWAFELVPLKNTFMRQAGSVAYAAFEEGAEFSQEPLISFGDPYYPDLTEAARDWLAIANYQGQSDTRNQMIVFLLPEARAFFLSATSDRGTLHLKIGGRQHPQLALQVKGAYWQGASLRHFSGTVKNGEVTLAVPDEVRRLEYVLIDKHGEVYDFQYESWGDHSGLVRERRNDGSDRLAALVREACSAGEGLRVEFKPLIDFREGLGKRGTKTKYRELVRTIVAFANAEGGNIYLGIDDDCGLDGIAEGLKSVARAAGTDDSFETYRGALVNRVRGDVSGEVPLSISSVSVDGLLIAVVEVPEAPAKPLSVRGENIYHLRVGANNKQLAPAEWATAFAARSIADLAWPSR